MIRLGSTPDIHARPLHAALAEGELRSGISVISQDTVSNCRDLIAGRLDVALVSALDYARNSSELKLVRDFAVYSGQGSRNALLFFRENLGPLTAVAAPLLDTPYQLLARIVLNEFYEQEVEWEAVEAVDSLEDALRQYPAVFLEGDPAMALSRVRDNFLDIVSEWSDKTELPFVHLLLAVPRESETTAFLAPLATAREVGMRRLMEIARAAAGPDSPDWDFYFDLITDTYRYYPDVDMWHGLRQYYEFLFYYGLVDFLPDVHFL